MRDGDIYLQFEHMAKAVSSDNAALNKGFALMRTRVDALERVMLGSRFGLLKMMVLQLISPKRVAGLVQMVHAAQINQYNQARSLAEANRPKIKPVTNGH